MFLQTYDYCFAILLLRIVPILLVFYHSAMKISKTLFTTSFSHGESDAVISYNIKVT